MLDKWITKKDNRRLDRISLRSRDLTGKNLEISFGPASQYAREGIDLLLLKIKKARSSVLMPIFSGWGYLKERINANTNFRKDALKKIAKLYSLSFPFEYMEIVFAIHTYLATIIKLVASEIVLNLKSRLNGKPLRNMSHLSTEDFKAYFILLEAGDIFRELGIENFMDDVMSFSWYLHFWDDRLETWLRSCVKSLANYSFNLQSQKRYIEDLFKNLYHKLLIPALRRELGEVFTPTWLAEFMVEDIGYTGDLEKRVLDPACGSGTFLLEIIKKVREWHQIKKIKPNVLAFQRSIIGFDLNPIAILAARTNFLWATADLLHFKLPFTIPVFLADCIDVKNTLFNEPITKFQGYFDFIIGNPPWINWEYLPEKSKETYMNLWSEYGLFPSKGWKGKLGYGKYDISAVFVYVCMDYYLKEHGKLEFLVTQAILRGIPGRGFRRFEIIKQGKDEDSIKLGLKKVHDLTSFQPFEEITNRTAILQLVRNEMTIYPIPYIEWEKKGQVSSYEGWDNIKKTFQLSERVAAPLKKDDALSRPLIADSKMQIETLREKIFQPSEYKAREGANTEGLNCVYWIQHLELASNGLIRFQQILKGAKKKIIAKETIPIEPDLIFPLIRSGDLQRWHYTPGAFIIFTLKYDAEIANESSFQTQFPEAYRYFSLNFKQELLTRKSFEKKSAKYPFYILFGTVEMKKPFKVCWLRMGSKVEAAVINEYENPLLGRKSPIPQETVVFVNVESLDEAHYLCAILNSAIFTDLISMFSMRGSKGFATVNILENIRILKFNPDDELHKQLAAQSMKAHEAAQRGADTISIENTINQLAEELFFADTDPTT